MDGVEIYRIIENELGNIECSEKYDETMESIENLKKYDILINCLLEDLDSAYYNSKGHNGEIIRDNVKKIMVDKLEWLEQYAGDYFE